MLKFALKLTKDSKMNEEQESQTNSTPADSPIASKQTTPDKPPIS